MPASEEPSVSQSLHSPKHYPSQSLDRQPCNRSTTAHHSHTHTRRSLFAPASNRVDLIPNEYSVSAAAAVVISVGALTLTHSLAPSQQSTSTSRRMRMRVLLLFLFSTQNHPNGSARLCTRSPRCEIDIRTK